MTGELEHKERNENEFFIQEVNGPEDMKPYIELHKVVGKVDLLNNSNGRVYSDLLKSGNFNISPYGYGEKDENGNIKDFNLVGFNITPKQNMKNKMSEEEVENLGSLIRDDVLDVNTLMEYLIERFKMILLSSWSKDSVNSLKRLFNLILKVKEAQLAKMHLIDLETNP